MTRELRRAALVAFGLLASAGVAAAGPISWSYSSTGGELDGLFLNGAPTTAMESEAGRARVFTPFAGYGPGSRYLPEPTGPVNLEVSISDTTSGESRAFDVPFYFYSAETDDTVNVEIHGHSKETFTLGDNTYAVEAAFDNHLSVSVTTANTPEPATLAMVPIGLAVVGTARRRRTLGERRLGRG